MANMHATRAAARRGAAHRRAAPMRVAAAVVGVAICAVGCGEVERTDPLAQGCALHLAMDEASWSGAPGEVRDACGGDDPGTARPGVSTVANGARGRAAQLTKRADCIDVADSPRLRPAGELTVSAWVRPSALSAASQEAFGVVSKRLRKDVDDSYNVSLWTGNKVWVELESADDRFAGNAELVNDRWTQVTVVYDGSQAAVERVRVFLDGQLDRVGPETAPTLSGSPVPLRVGCMPGVDDSGVATNQGFLGLLDDVVVWTRALGDAEVADWYELSRP